MKPRFENAVKKLYNAYHSDELAKGDCTKCAVGIICDNNTSWRSIFITSMEKNHQQQYPERYNSKAFGLAKQVIDDTGYTWRQLAKVEHSFEINTTIETLGSNNKREMKFFSNNRIEFIDYNYDLLKGDQAVGLRAVMVVLCKIEKIKNVSDYKNLFDTSLNHKQLFNNLF